MIIRIVKMSFRADAVNDFLDNFARHKEEIRHFPGCEHLELLQQVDEPGVYFTYSWWRDESDLEAYRSSELFQEVWAFTKKLFADRPQAWSVVQKEKL